MRKIPENNGPLASDPTEPMTKKSVAEQPTVTVAPRRIPPARRGDGIPALPDDFEFREVLGKGGMGVVLRVRQVSLQRDVALKILPGKLTSKPIYREMFLNEARLCAGLRHANIVQVYQAGVLPSGDYFYAMELVDGRTLDQLVREKGAYRALAGAHGAAAALRILFDLCDALELAHRQGIVHRDIKPQNVIVEKDGRARLMDFGIAVLRRDVPISAMPAGTPAYMAPEQAAFGDVDRRADIYALGGILFYLLTGDSPNTGETLSKLASQSQSHGTGLGDEKWALLSPDLRRLFKPVLDDLLASRANERIGSVGDVRRALERIYLELTSKRQSRRRALLKKRLVTAFAVLATVSAVAVGGFAIWSSMRRSNEPTASSSVSVNLLESNLRELKLELLRTDLEPTRRTLYDNWYKEALASQKAGNDAHAAEVAAYALAQIRMQQVGELARTLGSLGSSPQMPAELRQRVEQYLGEVNEARGEPEMRDLQLLQTQGMQLLAEVNRAMMVP